MLRTSPPDETLTHLPTLPEVSGRPDSRALRERESQGDSRLVAMARAGDQLAFAALVERYGQPILSLCYSSTLDREEARDLAQEVFLSAWRNLERYRGDAAFSTWLFALARNAAVDAARRRAARPPRTRAADQETPDWNESIPPGERETVAAIFDAAARLSQPLREAFLLRDLQGLSYEEIATIQKVPTGTVRSRIASARLTISQEISR